MTLKLPRKRYRPSLAANGGAGSGGGGGIGNYLTNVVGARYRAALNRHPFLLFGLPFLLTMLAGSFFLTPATAMRYERHDRKMRRLTREEELSVGRNRRKVDIREEYYVRFSISITLFFPFFLFLSSFPFFCLSLFIPFSRFSFSLFPPFPPPLSFLFSCFSLLPPFSIISFYPILPFLLYILFPFSPLLFVFICTYLFPVSLQYSQSLFF
jgi:hypothetical protein